MTEWEAFGALAVDYLGLPVEAMPLYSAKKKWSRKASLILKRIIETGNFGHNRDNSYRKNDSFVKRKVTSLLRFSVDTILQIKVFPMDSLKVWWRMLVNGVKSVTVD